MEAIVNSVNENDSIEYRAYGYYRLSKDDRNRNESDSISNQRKLVHNFVSANEKEIVLVGEAFDDGYTGTNYERPGFMTILNAIDTGEANCIIVKDLSRLGREYIETGRYLEMVFPAKKVRFIAINDDFDSNHNRAGDEIIIPVKNIMNEAYCRELSKKLRKQFKIQRRNGEFLGAFACYGYLKDPVDKHKLIVDEYAAEIVKCIFTMKLHGSSLNDIADFLNKEGVLAPSEYKKSLGLNYKTGLKAATTSGWSYMSVKNILTNPVYKGDLVQGKRGTPNYKIKNMRYRKAEEWVVVEKNHEPIIDMPIFEVVQRLMRRDTRKSPVENTIQPLAGILFCGDCQRAMCRRSVKRGNKKFFYYVCSSYKKGNGCSSHSFEQGKLEEIILSVIRNQIYLIIEADQFLADVDRDSVISKKAKSLDLMIAEKNKEIDGYQNFRMKLYEAFTNDLISRDEYDFMRKKYTDMINTAESAVAKLQEERRTVLEEKTMDKTWIGQFAKFKNITELSREVVVTLIDRINIFEDKRIEIIFNFHDEFELLMSIFKEVG